MIVVASIVVLAFDQLVIGGQISHHLCTRDA
jgi:hypothetical protein